MEITTANAKTYNELNQATSINASDLVAVAQSDKTELQKTTVNDLANAVGELNQAGALAELSLATSIGKNLLAQRLNEKGVDTITPNSTLVEMADAVNDLQTTDSTQFYTGYASSIGTARESGVIGDITVSQAFSIAILPQGKRIIYLDGTIYAISDGVYATIKDAIDHAVATGEIQHKEEMQAYLDTKTSGKRVGIGFSSDCKTVSIVYAFDASTKAVSADMYDIDWEKGSISFLKSITWTVDNNWSYYQEDIAISNDRKYILATYYTNSTMLLKNLDTDIQATVGVPNSSTGSDKCYFFSPSNEANTFYVIASGILYRGGFNDTGTKLTLNSLAKIYTPDGISAVGYYSYDIQKFVGFTYDNEKYRLRLWVYNLDGTNPTHFDIEYAYTWLYANKPSRPYYAESYTSATQHALFFASFKKDIETNKWYIKAPTLELAGLYYDADSNVLGCDNIKFLASCMNYWYYNRPQWNFAILLNLSDNKYITAAAPNGGYISHLCYAGTNNFLYNPNSDPIYIGCEQTINKCCVFVGIININGNELKYQYAPYLNRTDLLAGAYDLTTKQVEIPADSEATK